MRNLTNDEEQKISGVFFSESHKKPAKNAKNCEHCQKIKNIKKTAKKPPQGACSSKKKTLDGIVLAAIESPGRVDGGKGRLDAGVDIRGGGSPPKWVVQAKERSTPRAERTSVVAKATANPPNGKPRRCRMVSSPGLRTYCFGISLLVLATNQLSEFHLALSEFHLAGKKGVQQLPPARTPGRGRCEPPPGHPSE